MPHHVVPACYNSQRSVFDGLGMSSRQYGPYGGYQACKILVGGGSSGAGGRSLKGRKKGGHCCNNGHARLEGEPNSRAYPARTFDSQVGAVLTGDTFCSVLHEEASRVDSSTWYVHDERGAGWRVVSGRVEVCVCAPRALATWQQR